VSDRCRDYLLVLSCSSIVLSLFSIAVSLSSISLSILPSSSSRGPMYCPGLSGEGSGSMGRGRRGSGRLGRSNLVPVDPVGFSVFRVFIDGSDNSSGVILLSSTPGITVVVGFPFIASPESPCASERHVASFWPRTVEPQPPAFELYTRELDICQHRFYACQATCYRISRLSRFVVTPSSPVVTGAYPTTA